jgi:hypothetical protein
MGAQEVPGRRRRFLWIFETSLNDQSMKHERNK